MRMQACARWPKRKPAQATPSHALESEPGTAKKSNQYEVAHNSPFHLEKRGERFRAPLAIQHDQALTSRA
ncbi:hypothetical protein XFF7766_970026 [Xanthomonas citri pv. fuscans]|nr:hypothetical protein XFF7766_970026 [Xanthomonas citri pv. fuscans]